MNLQSTRRLSFTFNSIPILYESIWNKCSCSRVYNIIWDSAWYTALSMTQMVSLLVTERLSVRHLITQCSLRLCCVSHALECYYTEGIAITYAYKYNEVLKGVPPMRKNHVARSIQSREMDTCMSTTNNRGKILATLCKQHQRQRTTQGAHYEQVRNHQRACRARETSQTRLVTLYRLLRG